MTVVVVVQVMAVVVVAAEFVAVFLAAGRVGGTSMSFCRRNLWMRLLCSVWKSHQSGGCISYMICLV